MTSWRTWFVGLWGDFLGPALVVAAALVVSGVRGQLGNMAEFYGHPGIIEAYSASGSPLLSGFASLPSLNVVLVWIPAVVLGGAILLRWGVASPRFRLLASMLAVVGAAGAPLLTKDAVRPLTGDLTLILVLVVLLCVVSAAAHLLDVRWRVAPAGLGLIVGLLAAALAISGEAPALTSGISATPGRVYRDLAIVARPSPLDRSVEQQRFDRSHFAQYVGELALAKAIKPLVGSSQSNLYVLGDAPIEYILLGQRPPWEINVYNSSPIGDQHRVVRWIEDHKPKVVVLSRQSGQVFDGVPDDVRIPLVYQQVVTHYVPERTLGEFDVLRRRHRGEKSAATFWLNRLGNVLDLGAIPDAEPPLSPAAPGGVQTPVLHLSTGATESQRPVSVPLRFGGSVVTIEFQPVQGRTSYEIPIDRLWPWALSHRVGMAGAASAGWSASISSGSLPRSRLY